MKLTYFHGRERDACLRVCVFVCGSMSSQKYAYEIGQLLKNLNATTSNIPRENSSTTATMPADQQHTHTNPTTAHGVLGWSCENVSDWARKEGLSRCIIDWIAREDIDGRCLLAITEQDVHDLPQHCASPLRFGDIKRFWFATRLLQRQHLATTGPLGLAGLWTPDYSMNDIASSVGHHHPMHHQPHHHQQQQHQQHAGMGTPHHHPHPHPHHHASQHHHHHAASLLSSMGTSYGSVGYSYSDLERISPPMSIDGCATCIQPEFFKTMISLGTYMGRGKKGTV